MTTDTNSIHDTLAVWQAAEAGGDAAALTKLLADDFTGVGPLGFTLTKDQWIERFTSGAFHYDSFALDKIDVHTHGDATTVVAVQNAVGAYQGNPTPPTLRVTAVFTDEGTGRRLANVHTSYMPGTPGAPPIPGQAS